MTKRYFQTVAIKIVLIFQITATKILHFQTLETKTMCPDLPFEHIKTNFLTMSRLTFEIISRPKINYLRLLLHEIEINSLNYYFE